MRAAAFLWLLSTAAAAAEVGYDAEVRGEQQVRAFSGSGVSATGTFELLPTLRGTLHEEDTTVSLTYSPQLIIGSLGTTDSQLLHRGKLALDEKLGTGRRLTLSEQGSYGTLD